ncbi:MAG: lipoate--protein ligase family protein [Ignavibacteria bacterium]|nr:MAG: lipoate--protein ligase family protein [Ignavibacteria bacterium]
MAQQEGIGVVKRPTGGRAILHAEEITYSVVIPSDKIESSKSLYNKISHSLVKGLKIYDNRLNGLELESLQPHFPSLLKQESGMICFSSTARHEVKFAGKKLIGSAQRKMNGVILQHGSILLGDYHLNLPKFLNVDDESKVKLINEMKDKTISLEEILSEKTDENRLIDSLVKGFEKTWNISFEKEKLIV